MLQRPTSGMLPPMTAPPTQVPDEVTSFRALYEREFGVELDARYARELVRLGVPVTQARHLIEAVTAVAENVIEQQLRRPPREPR